jgi:putative radical SAM enzyme (TIGR03279 family)
VVRIAQIEAGSIAEELSLQIGTRLVRINGQPVRDGIDLTLLLADPDLEIETVSPDGEAVIYEVEKEPGESLGIVPAPDKVRECSNACVFCFIDGNPQGVRNSLWLKDDDFRLSFTYGSYVTLTNLGPKGLQRLVDQRISPLYVSVHATEPDVRVRLLKNPRAGEIMDHLRYFADNGLEVHTQVVLCPDWNDGEHLTRTIEDLWSIGPAIRSLSVVPVGLTRYNLGKPVRLLTPAEGRKAIAQVDAARGRALAERDTPWAYAADEMFLVARSDLPEESYYGDGGLLENGVGAVRRFLTDFDEGLATLSKMPGKRIRIVTAASMAPFIRERASRLAEATSADVQVVETRNDFFGETVTVAGLLAGQDIARALGEGRENDIVLLPAECLNADRLFIDSKPLAELEQELAPAQVISGYEVTASLRSIEIR